MGPLQPHRQLRPLILVLLAACGGRGRAVDPAPAAVPSATAAAPVDPATACAPLRPERANPVLGVFPRAAEPLDGVDVDGRPFDLSSLRGRVVLVSFTSDWDMVTKKERPTFAALRDAVGDGLVIVRVVSSESLEKAKADRLASEGYPTVFDAERSCSPLGDLTNRWGVRAVPESFLVDRAGNVRFYFINKRDWSTPDAEACVRALLADTTPPITEPPRAAAPEECPPNAAGDAVARGTATVAPSVKHKVRPGQIFLVAKRADASGQPVGPPLGVDGVQYAGDPVPFGIVQMLASAAVDGDIVISGRWDQDGDAMTKQSGDITGTVRATAPASGVKLVLDTVLP